MTRRLGRPTPPPHGHPRIAARIARLEATLSGLQERLEARLIEVEEGLEEQKALNAHITELTNLVNELIAAAAANGDPDFDRILDRYAASL